MSNPVTVRPPAPSAPAAGSWPDAFASSADSTSDTSPSTVNTADTSLSGGLAPSAFRSDGKDCGVTYGPIGSNATRRVEPAPFRPRTPPQINPTWRYSMPDPGLTSPTSPLTSPDRGAKRTASGAFKFTSPSVLSPVRSAKHARNASTDSNQSRVSEVRNAALTSDATTDADAEDVKLSAQLKARLSYAMIKVQNGWEHKTLNEVERLAMHSPNFSPRSRGAFARARQGERRVDGAAHAAANPHYKGRSRGVSDAAVMQATMALYQQPGLSSAMTVEDVPNPFRSVPQLATPRPGRAERVSPTEPLQGRPVSSNGVSQPANGNAAQWKQQPFPTLRGSTPTPQEQDALDSLVSMSSPAHSVRYSRKHPNGTSNAASTAASSLQGSPTRTGFPPTGVASKPGSMPPPALRSQSSRGSGSSTGLEAMVTRNSALRGPVRTNQDVERLLDEVQAQSSDEAEEEL